MLFNGRSKRSYINNLGGTISMKGENLESHELLLFLTISVQSEFFNGVSSFHYYQCDHHPTTQLVLDKFKN